MSWVTPVDPGNEPNLMNTKLNFYPKMQPKSLDTFYPQKASKVKWSEVKWSEVK